MLPTQLFKNILISLIHSRSFFTAPIHSIGLSAMAWLLDRTSKFAPSILMLDVAGFICDRTEKETRLFQKVGFLAVMVETTANSGKDRLGCAIDR
jgi:hypothetical protein